MSLRKIKQKDFESICPSTIMSGIASVYLMSTPPCSCARWARGWCPPGLARWRPAASTGSSEVNARLLLPSVSWWRPGCQRRCWAIEGRRGDQTRTQCSSPGASKACPPGASPMPAFSFPHFFLTSKPLTKKFSKLIGFIAALFLAKLWGRLLIEEI